MICKNCGHGLDGNMRYCPNCGTMVDQGASYRGTPFPPPGAMPPPIPPQYYVPPKKNKAILPIFIVVMIAIFLIICSATVLTAIGIYEAVKEGDLSQATEEYDQYFDDDSYEDYDSYDNYDDSSDSYDDSVNPYDDYSEYDSYPNYDTFLQGRELNYYEQYTEVVMENGIGFYLNNIRISDLGDGTAAVEVNVDLASYYDDNYLYAEDFLMLPLDEAGNALSDACSVGYIYDSVGNNVTVPVLLDTAQYQNYTITFLVPAMTSTINLYGVNYSAEGFSGPAYCTELKMGEQAIIP